MSESLVPLRFQFRFCLPCFYRETIWSKGALQLDERHRLLSLEKLDDAPTLADVRAAWNEKGLAFSAVVTGKGQAPWCRESRVDESDGLHVWIDTRDTHNVHRASRFCHRFAFLPFGGGPQMDAPVAKQLGIHRAREQAKPAAAGSLNVRGEVRPDGYLVEGCIRAEALTGFDPPQHPRLGFTYCVLDRERGEQTFTAGHPFRYEEDPSLWGSLELAR